MTDYRALCAELIENLEIHCEIDVYSLKLINRARLALAEPEPPADGEVAELVAKLRTKAITEHANGCDYSTVLLTRAADLLERLAPQPQPVRPTVMEIIELSSELDGSGDVALVRAALARWGTPNLAQVRSSLGTTGPSDLDLISLWHGDRDYRAVPFARAVLARWGQP